MPWKNGSGTTYEIVVFPENDTSLDTFEWRVSMAHVETAGPFSIFPGIDRSLAIMEGEGLTLQMTGLDSITVGQNTAPAFFPGDVPTTGSLLAGPVVDLNIMTRRDVWSHRVTLCDVTTEAQFDERICSRILIARNGHLMLRDGDTEHELSPGDAVLLNPGASPPSLFGSPEARFFRIDLFRRDASKSPCPH